MTTFIVAFISVLVIMLMMGKGGFFQSYQGESCCPSGSLRGPHTLQRDRLGLAGVAGTFRMYQNHEQEVAGPAVFFQSWALGACSYSKDTHARSSSRALFGILYLTIHNQKTTTTIFISSACINVTNKYFAVPLQKQKTNKSEGSIILNSSP